MAGSGSRLAGYQSEIPKPLVEIAGHPMIAWALKSLEHLHVDEYIFIALKEHDQKFGISTIIRNLIGSNSKVILISEVTQGQLCTVLAAQDEICNDDELLIASSDTFIKSNIGEHLKLIEEDCHGLISVAMMPGEQWSFVSIDKNSHVIEVAEKTRISPYASTGLYYFSNGKEFVENAEDIIRSNNKTHGEYYVIPVYKNYIERGWIVEISLAEQMWDMGTPVAIADFENAVISKRISI